MPKKRIFGLCGLCGQVRLVQNTICRPFHQSLALLGPFEDLIPLSTLFIKYTNFISYDPNMIFGFGKHKRICVRIFRMWFMRMWKIYAK